MPEEAHEAPATPDTPDTEVDVQVPVEETPGTPQIDWEKRYNDLRSFADRRHQETLQSFEDRIAELGAPAAPAGPAVDDDEDDWYDNPLEDPRIAAQIERLDRLEAQLTQKSEQETLARKQAEKDAYIDGELDRIEAAYKDSLSDDEAKWIGNYALAHQDEHGNPDVELAYVTYNRLLEGRKSKWVDNKRSAASPATGPGAVEVPEFETRQQRLDYINQRIAAMEAGEGN